MKERADYKTRFKSQGEGIPGGTKPLSVAFPPDIDSKLRSLPNRSCRLRQLVIQGMILDPNLSSLPAEALAKLEQCPDKGKAIAAAIEVLEKYGFVEEWLDLANR